MVAVVGEENGCVGCAGAVKGCENGSAEGIGID